MPLTKCSTSFRPLAGLSCINLGARYEWWRNEKEFPSPRGVELHKPLMLRLSVLWPILWVSVPSRG